jgi:hypothetical protein
VVRSKAFAASASRLSVAAKAIAVYQNPPARGHGAKGGRGVIIDFIGAAIVHGDDRHAGWYLLLPAGQVVQGDVPGRLGMTCSPFLGVPDVEQDRAGVDPLLGVGWADGGVLPPE